HTSPITASRSPSPRPSGGSPRLPTAPHMQPPAAKTRSSGSRSPASKSSPPSPPPPPSLRVPPSAGGTLSSTHSPRKQNWPSGQRRKVHGSARQLPVKGSQTAPAGQLTPSHIGSTHAPLSG